MSDETPLEEIGYYDYAGSLGMPYFHWGGIRATDRLTELLNINTESDVLMVGCGTGYSGLHIAKNTGCTLTGIDISPSMITRAKERLEEWGLQDRVRFDEGDAYDLHFEDASFDVVLTEFVSVFLEKHRAFPEFARVLRLGGLMGVNELWIADEMPETAREKIQKAQLGFEKAAGLPLVIPTLYEWKSFFQEVGLQDIEQEEVTYKYSFGEMRRVAGLGKLLRMSGRTLWDMARNSTFRKRMWPIGQLKDILVRDKDTRDLSGAVLCIGKKPLL